MSACGFPSCVLAGEKGMVRIRRRRMWIAAVACQGVAKGRDKRWQSAGRAILKLATAT